MTSEAFRDALAKGQGRTALILQTEDPAPYVGTILAACVENLQYDRQCEAGRGLYVMRLVDLAELRDRALDAVLEALPKAEKGWDRDWMVDLLEEFAKGGKRKAWKALRALAANGDKQAQDNLALVDEPGLEWVEANVLPTLAEDDRWRIGMWLPDEEADDATPAQHRLRILQKENGARLDARRGADARLKTETKPKAWDFFKALDQGEAGYGSPFVFARIATAKELREAAERLLRETNYQSAWRLAQVFRDRAFPLPLRRLFSQAAHEDRGLAICRILGDIDAPQIRHFVRRLLKTRPLPWGAVGALGASFRPGDEALVADVLPEVETYRRKHLHNVVLDVVGFFRTHPKGDWQNHAEWVYEHSPCSMCRASAVRWMGEHGVLPEAIQEEGAYDAEPDVRECVATKA